jgi:hypothetical protein
MALCAKGGVFKLRGLVGYWFVARAVERGPRGLWKR